MGGFDDGNDGLLARVDNDNLNSVDGVVDNDSLNGNQDVDICTKESLYTNNKTYISLLFSFLPLPPKCQAIFNQLSMNRYLASMVENNNDGLIYPLFDSTEAVIQRTIEGIQKMMSP